MAMVDSPSLGTLPDLTNHPHDLHFPAIPNEPSPEELAFETFCADRIICEIESHRSHTSTWMTIRFESLRTHIEMRLHPELRDLPFVICDSVNQGVIIEVSPKCYGIAPGMSLFAALTVLPGLRPVVADWERYLGFRARVEEVLGDYDRAFSFSGLAGVTLELTDFCNETGGDGQAVAREIRMRIGERVDCPLKIGIGGSRIASRIAAGEDAEISVAPTDRRGFLEFVGSAPIEVVPGMSVKRIEKLKGFGIRYVGQIIENRGLISFSFSRRAVYSVFSAALGVDRVSNVRPVEMMFLPAADFGELAGRLKEVCEKLARRLAQSDCVPAFMKVRLRDVDGNVATKCAALRCSSMEFCDLYAVAYGLLKDEDGHGAITSVKVTVSERPFASHSTQQTLGKWTVGQLHEKQRIVKDKKVVLEDFWAMRQRLPAPKKKFRPKRNVHDRLIQRTLI
jgi:nucleotidyltransferase/DNA polymerase involved in DNA repair